MNNKYHSKRITIEGEQFDSAKEYRRWCELKFLRKAGQIRDLKRQVEFVLIPAQYDDKGKCLERKCSYFADFCYHDVKTGRYIVEDTKGHKTKDYIIKRKMMLHFHGIRIQEV